MWAGIALDVLITSLAGGVLSAGWLAAVGALGLLSGSLIFFVGVFGHPGVDALAVTPERNAGAGHLEPSPAGYPDTLALANGFPGRESSLCGLKARPLAQLVFYNGSVSTPILATKRYIPPLRPHVARGPRLIERRKEGLQRELTLRRIF